MHTEIPNKYQSFITELQTASKPQKFDIKSITTYGVLRLSQLQNISHQQIRQQTFKQLVTKTVKVCHLYDPVLKTLQQQDINIDLKHPNPNNLLKVNSILKILYENLFYRHMVKLKIDNSDIDITQSQSFNCRNYSFHLKKTFIRLQEIGTVLLMYNLQENLIKLKPYGLPLQQGFLQKCLKKIERILNNTDLKNFISAVKEEGRIFDQNDKTQHQISGSVSTNNSKQYLIGPDHFLYLVALSEKKTQNPMIFFHNFNTKTHTKSIQILMERKKSDNISNEGNQPNVTHSSHHHNGLQNGSNINNHPHQNKQNVSAHSNFNSVNSKAKQKVRGLTLYEPESTSLKNIKHHQQIYQQIKVHLRNNIKFRSNSLQKQVRIPLQQINNKKKEILKSKSKQDNYKKSKSVVLLNQMNKNKRPSSAFFKRSIELYQKNKQLLVLPKNVQNFNDKMTTKSSLQTNTNKSLNYRSKSQCMKNKNLKTIEDQNKMLMQINKEVCINNTKSDGLQKGRHRSQTNYMKIANQNVGKSYSNFKRSQTAHDHKNIQKKSSNHKIQQITKGTQDFKEKGENIFEGLVNNQSNFDLQFYHTNSNDKYFGLRNSNRLCYTDNVGYKNYSTSSNIQGKFSKTVNVNQKTKKETIIKKNGVLKIKENRILKLQNRKRKQVRIQDKENSEQGPNIQINIIEKENQETVS